MPIRATPLHDVPEAILWEEGMLLAPPHFQQAAQRQEEVLGYQVQLAAPFHWGVAELTWDLRDLPQNLLRVDRLEAVMPDGLAVRSHPGVPLEVDLSAVAASPSPQPVRVWLTLPAARRAGEPSGGRDPRWCLGELETVLDEHTHLDAEVRRIRPALRLEAGPTPDPRRVALPLAEVQRVNGALEPGAYVPPLLRAGPGTLPHRWCVDLAREIRNRATDLSQRAPQADDVAHQVRVLGAALPAFEAVVRTGRAHPFALFHALCAFAGALSAASPGAPVPPPLFAPYDHDDLATSFAPVRAYVRQVLDGLARTRNAQRFAPLENGFRLPVLQEGWVRDGEIVVGVTAREGSNEAEVAAWMAACRIGSEGAMEAMRDRRILGAVRTRLPDPRTRAMSAPRGEALFVVQVDPELIQTGKPLLIVNPNDPAGRARPAEAVLYSA